MPGRLLVLDGEGGLGHLAEAQGEGELLGGGEGRLGVQAGGQQRKEPESRPPRPPAVANASVPARRAAASASLARFRAADMSRPIIVKNRSAFRRHRINPS